MKKEYHDYVVIGAGIYGLYASHLLLKKKFNVAVLECDDKVFGRASYVNQARLHQGYHYPRSIGTARMTAKYFLQFLEDFKPAMNLSFKKIYAISKRNSFTSHRQFLKFCEFCNIPAIEINPEIYFNPNTVEGAYETQEYAFDPKILGDILLENNERFEKFHLYLNKRIVGVGGDNCYYNLKLEDGSEIKTRGVINCTYASVNQTLHLFDFEMLDLKYEIAEIILCKVNRDLQDVGITVLDGPFFSIMPFGTKIHSLSSVEFTPHKTSFNKLPIFECQEKNPLCTQYTLQNCNTCPAKPGTAFVYMNQLAKKYLKSTTTIIYESPLFAIKPILMISELDDSRPTVIRKYSDSPLFVSILSGKINTVYEIGKVIDEI